VTATVVLSILGQSRKSVPAVGTRMGAPVSVLLAAEPEAVCVKDVGQVRFAVVCKAVIVIVEAVAGLQGH
jgi:hypothetical protein